MVTSNTPPLVSIVIPNYNYGKYIEDCVISCMQQDYLNLEVVVIDDRSTDRSREVLEHMVNQFNNLTVFYSPENGGYSLAKNAGIGISKGEYIVHLDADDMLTDGSITSRMNAFKEDPMLDFVHANAYLVYDDVNYIKCLRHQKLKKLEVDKSPYIHAQTWMVKRQVFDRFGIYYNMRSKSDKEMLWRLGLCKGQEQPLIKAKKIKDVVAFYRRHHNCMINYRKKHPDYDKMIVKTFKERQRIYESEGVTKENTPFL